ncbi:MULTISPECIES: hypothetical protein [Mycolicibacterium]|jgi:hypothetical protein|uniref:hypothetical protein n=1 Tax=Mycolicibacterium TaxID=1866885 RepID=UPI00298CBB1E|nr:hypothetical protein [Mycolicibacterium sp. D5.8-2]MDW5610009.1 hypothetical protein [Mycolicibacterium sp. D5.8-2]
MTDFNTEHLPTDAVVITAIQAQVGRGYEASTGTSFVSLSVLDRRRGAFTILLDPEIADDIGTAVIAMSEKARTTHTHKEDQ